MTGLVSCQSQDVQTALFHSKMFFLLQHPAFFLLPTFVSMPSCPHSSLLSGFAVYKSTLTVVREPAGVEEFQKFWEISVCSMKAASKLHQLFLPHPRWHPLTVSSQQTLASLHCFPGYIQTNTLSRIKTWSFYRERGTKENQ